MGFGVRRTGLKSRLPLTSSATMGGPLNLSEPQFLHSGGEEVNSQVTLGTLERQWKSQNCAPMRRAAR